MEGPVINLPNAMRIAMLASLIGCVGATTTHVIDVPSSQTRLLTATDLQSVNTATLYEVVAQLRPNFVRANLRGERPTVFVNGFLAGSVEVLRHLAPRTVKDVRLLRGADATARYGNVHNGSIIDVTLRSR
jgi:hypothetical protein